MVNLWGKTSECKLNVSAYFMSEKYDAIDYRGTRHMTSPVFVYKADSFQDKWLCQAAVFFL